MEQNNENPRRILRPVNQKSVYHSFADLYDKIMNDEIGIDKAETACHALAGMNRAFTLEIKLAELEQQTKIRQIELKKFDEFARLD